MQIGALKGALFRRAFHPEPWAAPAHAGLWAQGPPGRPSPSCQSEAQAASWVPWKWPLALHRALEGGRPGRQLPENKAAPCPAAGRLFAFRLRPSGLPHSSGCREGHRIIIIMIFNSHHPGWLNWRRGKGVAVLEAGTVPREQDPGLWLTALPSAPEQAVGGSLASQQPAPPPKWRDPGERLSASSPWRAARWRPPPHVHTHTL